MSVKKGPSGRRSVQIEIEVPGTPEEVWQAITDWTRSLRGPVFLSYRGNIGTLRPDNRLRYVPKDCPHYPPDAVGEPTFQAM